MVLSLLLSADACAGQSTKRQTPSPPPAPPGIFPADLAWTRALDAAAPTGAVTDRMHVYLGLDDGRVVALNRETGETVWSAAVATTAPLVVHDSSVYALTPAGLIVIDAASGSINRRLSLPGMPAGPMTRSGDTLLILIEPHTLLAWQIPESRQLWTRELRAPTHLAPAVSGDSVFVALDDSRITALGLKDGNERWTTQLAGRPLTLAASHPVAIVGSSDRVVYALDEVSGSFKWTRKAAADIVGLAVDDKCVFVVALDNSVRAFDKHRGSQQWKTVLDTRVVVAPEMTSAGILLAGVDSGLMLISPKNGRSLGTYALPELAVISTSPLLLDERTPEGVASIVVTRDGSVLGIKPKPAPAAKDPSAAEAPDPAPVAP